MYWLDEITEEVLKLLQKLNPHKACRPDSISPRVQWELVDKLAPALTLTHNSSLTNGIIPADLRTVFVAPVFIKGKWYSPQNYIPISFTKVVCRVLEHVVSSIMQYQPCLHALLYHLRSWKSWKSIGHSGNMDSLSKFWILSFAEKMEREKRSFLFYFFLE